MNSPNPSLESFFNVTQTISLSGGVRVGVSTKENIAITKTTITKIIIRIIRITRTRRRTTTSKTRRSRRRTILFFIF